MSLIYEERENEFKSQYTVNTPSETAEKYLNYYSVTGKRECFEKYVKDSIIRYNHILITKSGSGKIIMGGKTYILEPGTFFFMKKMTSYKGECGEGLKWEFYWIDIYGEQARRMLEYCSEKYGHIIKLRAPDEMYRMMEKLINYEDESISKKEFVISDMLTDIINEVIYSRITNDNLSDKNERIVSKICKTIDREPEKEYRISEISKEYYLSENHLIRVFKKIMGYSPYEYIVKKRVHKASEILLDTDLPINETALLCGFKNQSNFTRKFREVYGMSPTDYRKNPSKNSEA